MTAGADQSAERTTRTPEETEALGAELAARLSPGDVVLLSGELGTGKTTLVRGAARALGVTDPVTSPTFTVGRRYHGRLPVAHLDLHRLGGLEDEEPGLLAEYLGPAGIAFVEWGELAARPSSRPPRARDPGPRRRRRRRIAVEGAVRVLAWDTATAATAVALLDTAPRTSLSRPRRPRARRAAGARHATCSRWPTGCCARRGASWARARPARRRRRPGLVHRAAHRPGHRARPAPRARGLPLAGVSTLRALAARAEAEPEFRPSSSLAVIDARRGEAFAAAWRDGAEAVLAPGGAGARTPWPSGLRRAARTRRWRWGTAR